MEVQAIHSAKHVVELGPRSAGSPKLCALNTCCTAESPGVLQRTVSKKPCVNAAEGVCWKPVEGKTNRQVI